MHLRCSRLRRRGENQKLNPPRAPRGPRRSEPCNIFFWEKSRRSKCNNSMLWTAMSKNKIIQTRRSTLALTGGKPACYEQLSMESCLPQIFARNAPCGGNAPQLHVRRRVTTQHSWPTQSERQLTEETCLRILRFQNWEHFKRRTRRPTSDPSNF